MKDRGYGVTYVPIDKSQNTLYIKEVSKLSDQELDKRIDFLKAKLN